MNNAAAPHDLPWSPTIGQTALYVIASTAERVLCADKTRAEYRSLWTADGRLLAQSGPSLTLAGIPFSPRGRRWREAPDEGATLDAIERLTLEALARAPITCFALATATGRDPDKTFLALLSLAKRGHAARGPAGDATPRSWSLTPSGAEALRASQPPAAPIAAAPVIASHSPSKNGRPGERPLAKPSTPPTQLALF